MPERKTNKQLLREARRAVAKFAGDTSVPLDKTLEGLEELEYAINNVIAEIKEELDKQEKLS